MDVNDLIKESRELINKKAGNFVNERVENFPPRHYSLQTAHLCDKAGRTKQTAERNFTVIHVYQPNKLWLGQLLSLTKTADARLILHSHKGLLPCKPEDLCHEYGFVPPVGQEMLWSNKWGLIYPKDNRQTNKNWIQLSLTGDT